MIIFCASTPGVEEYLTNNWILTCLFIDVTVKIYMDNTVNEDGINTASKPSKKLLRLIPLLLLLLAPIILVYLLKKSTIFESRATADNIVFLKSDGTPLTKENNVFVTDSLRVKVKLEAPPAP